VGVARACELTNSQAAALRAYLLHGGFVFCDGFFGDNNWAPFEERLPHMTSVQIRLRRVTLGVD
jgi:Domain of unknown function (DUF4159)